MKIDFQTSEGAVEIDRSETPEVENIVDKTDSLDTAILNAIVEHTASDYPVGAYHCASFVELHREELCGVSIAGGNVSKELITVYGMALEQSFSYSEGKLNQVGGSHMPVVITFEVADNTYTVTDFGFPEMEVIMYRILGTNFRMKLKKMLWIRRNMWWLKYKSVIVERFSIIR